MEKSELDKLLRYFTHEHSNGMATINNCIKILEFKMENNISMNKEDYEKIIDWMKHGKKRANDSVDYLYTKLKNK